MTALTYSSGSAMATTFPTQASIDAYAGSMATSPSVVFLAGPPVALDTLAGIVLNKVSFLGLVGVCLMAVLQVVRHTRAEEEEGRSELVRAGGVGRDAAPAATLLMTGTAAVLVGLGQALATAAAQVPLGDALLYGASVTALGLVFAAIALCTAQVFTHARAASGAALALFGVAYVVRGVGDVQESWLVWLSPIGWSQATHATGADATWWPLLVPLVASALLVGLAVRLQGLRDAGAGLFAGRPGNANAPRSLSSAFGLAYRTQRGFLLGWVVGLGTLGAVYGSLTQGVEDLARSNPTLEEFFRAAGQGSLVDSFLSTMLLVLALLAGAYAVSSALRLASEETSGRLETLLATGLSRSRWMLGTLTMTALGSAAVLLAAGARARDDVRALDGGRGAAGPDRGAAAGLPARRPRARRDRRAGARLEPDVGQGGVGGARGLVRGRLPRQPAQPAGLAGALVAVLAHPGGPRRGPLGSGALGDRGGRAAARGGRRPRLPASRHPRCLSAVVGAGNS